MKKRTILTLALLFFILNNSICYAGGISSVDKQSAYQSAIIYVSWGNYAEGLRLFEQAQNYSDSNSWANYCRGMLAIEAANEYEKTGYRNKAYASIESASHYFSLLPAALFPDRENLIRYCNARLNQLKGLLQPALDEYAEIDGTLDSYERSLNIYVPLPTQVPEKELPAYLPSIPANAAKKISTYLGPGSEYAEQHLIKINGDSEISICGREKDYFLMETKTENGKLRFWATTVWIMRSTNKQEPQIGAKSRKAIVLRDTKALMGPGEDYIASGITVKKGEKVLSFHSEGLYTMIEYHDEQTSKPIRLWVLSEDLSN